MGRLYMEKMCIASRNRILYNPRAKKQQRLFVSGTEFDRRMSQVVKGAKDVRTIIFPSAFKELSYEVFQETPVRSVILNEGIEKLEGHAYTFTEKSVTVIHTGIFNNTQIR